MDTPDTGQAWCVRCGYNLYRLTRARCPECGTPFDPGVVASQVFRESLERLHELRDRLGLLVISLGFALIPFIHVVFPPLFSFVISAVLIVASIRTFDRLSNHLDDSMLGHPLATVPMFCLAVGSGAPIRHIAPVVSLGVLIIALMSWIRQGIRRRDRELTLSHEDRRILNLYEGLGLGAFGATVLLLMLGRVLL